jgi:hypothetical protein
LSVREQLNRIPLFTLMAGFSLAIGLLVPTIFEWSESPAARSRHPEMERAALMAIVVALLFAGPFWLLKNPERETEEALKLVRDKPVQFGIRHLLIAMTLVAILAAGIPLIKDVIAPWVVMGAIAGLSLWAVFLGPVVRSRVGALMSAVFLPFAWIVPYCKPWGHVSGMLEATLFGPGILPALLLVRGTPDDSVWIAAILVLIYLGIGFWLARRNGSILFLVYLSLAFLASAFSSFIFHALFRM